MAHLDTAEAFKHFQDRTLTAIKGYFPMKGKVQTIHLDSIEVKDNLHPDDLKAQHKAKLEMGSFAVPVFGQMRMVDNVTGKVVDQRRIRLAEIPKMTQRYSYLLDGQEYQIDNQWQLKPGVYARRRQTGELEAQFNTTNKAKFDVVFDPESKQFRMEYGKANLPMYPLMKAMGVDDDTMEKTLGKEIVDANKKARGLEGTFEKFYKADRKESAPSREAALAHFVTSMQQSTMRPETNSLTLGKPIDHVNGESFLLAAHKLVKVHGGHPEDDRDSLIFKELRSAGDFSHDKIRGAKKVISAKVDRKINTATDIRDVVKFDLFNDPILEAFHKNSAARAASQINPVEMVSSAMQTTIMGPGGIQSEHQVMDEAKFVNASHLGFMDPINTPEGSKTGVTLRLPISIRRVGSDVRVPLHNLKTGKTDLLSPGEFLNANVVMPDQVTWKDGKPKPVGPVVKMAGIGNEIKDAKFSDGQYVMRHSSQLFNMTSNLIPFLNNSSGGRASMGARHIEQAISLVNRDAPLVQVGTGTDKAHIATFEKVLGSHASHSSPVNGTITSVKADSIHIKGPDGKSHEVQIYNNFPLNDAKSVFHSTALVKTGDKVKAGQVLADSNYSKNGVLALGANLHVGYFPFKGYNFEDGVVISETASNKLASQHMYKHTVPVLDDTVLNKKRYNIQHPGMFQTSQMGHLGDDGVAIIGSKVKPGDPLVLAMRPFQLKDRSGVNAYRRSVSGSHTDNALRWDGEVEGEVVAVSKSKDGLQVHVKTVEPMQVGDKLAGRYGNKGIVTLVLPDKEMPHTPEGKHIEVALNPAGVTSRMNIGQILETAVSKIAMKTGKPYIAENFVHGVDMVAHVQGEMKKHGLSDTEELHDPVTGQAMGKALVGYQHIIKLVHQVDKKVAVSPGMGLPGQPGVDKYDLNLQPSSGQRIGALGLFAMLAHGAKANIREMQTWKGEGSDPQTSEAKRWPSQHNQVWSAIQTGAPLPTPKPTFAFKKFEDLLRGAGINMEKHGHSLMLTPLTDKHIAKLTENRLLPKPADRLDARVDNKTGELKPRPGGLFDEKLTGGHGGTKWSGIELAEPLPNPVFEGPIRALTGLSKKDFAELIGSTKGVNHAGQLVDYSKGVMTGGHAIEHMLKKIDVPSALAQAKKDLNKAKPADIDKTVKKVKYLRALDQLGMKAHEAYVLHTLPVLPPVMRPASLMSDGNIKYADVNELYKNFALINNELKDKVISQAPVRQAELRRGVYDGMRAITGFGIPYDQTKNHGLLHQISGASPKTGFFQNTVVQKRQDLTMRSTIVPEPSLGLDELGLPKAHALDLFRPFIVKKIQEMGGAVSPLDAQKVLASKAPIAYQALAKVMEERPVLLKRDPALHKYSVQGFQSRIVEGNAIKVHPLVCGGFNADFDGDTMSVFVPISREAVAEAHKMKPTNNIFMESSGKVAYAPTMESALGIYKLSIVGKDTKHTFSNPGQLLDAVKSKKIIHTDVVKLNGKRTTAGRVLLSTTMPEALQHDVLHNLDKHVDKDELNTLLTRLGKEHAADFGVAVNKLKDMGNEASFGSVTVPLTQNSKAAITDPKHQVFIPIGTHTLSLQDFRTDTETRDRVLHAADKKVEAIHALNITTAEKNRRQVEVYNTADSELKTVHKEKAEKDPSNLFTMHQAGVKPNWNQYKQMVIAPMLVKDSADRIIPTPVRNSYGEGLDVSGYWTQMHGARRGAVMKVQEVQEPGYMSKLLMNSMMDTLITGHNCGTSKGISMHVGDENIHDRVLARDFKSGSVHMKAGTIITPDLISQVRSAEKDAKLLVRSPLKCEHEKGICQQCAGLAATGKFHDIGTNIGVLAAHTVGERAVQLTLRVFHTGGVVEQGGGKLLNSFARFQQLTNLPKQIPNASHLAMVSGKIEKIEPMSTGVNVFIGGKKHYVGKDVSGMPLHQPLVGDKSWGGLKIGMHVDAGDTLSDPSRTYMNPHDLYKATHSIDTVQNHMATEMYDLYKDEGIKRSHVETVVKAMSNLTKVVHPGDAPGILRGEFQPLSHIQKVNTDLIKAGRTPIEHTPVLKGVNMLPLSLQEDWMAKLQHQKLRNTLADAGAMAAISHIHGDHPIPAAAYGAEFGLTEQQSKLPGYGHLSTVPKHYY